MTNPYLALVAQLETRGGKATAKGPQGEDSFNVYNIKETRDGRRKDFVLHDKAEGSTAPYRAYGSRDEADADMEDLLKRRYPEAYAAMQKPWAPESVKEFAQGLKSRGYATDPEYANKLVSVAKRMPQPADQPLIAAGRAIAHGAPQQAAKPPALATQLQTAIWDLQVREESRPTVFESFGAAVKGNTDQRILNQVMDLFNDRRPDPAFQVPEAMLKGVDQYTARQRAEAVNQQHLDDIVQEQKEDVERGQAIMAHGEVAGFGLGLASEMLSVTNLATGFATAGIGMAAKTRRLTRLSQMAGVNVVTGTGLEAALQVAEGRPDPADLLVNALADLTMTGVGAGVVFRGEQVAAVRAAASDRVAQELSLLREAEANLGRGATAEQLQAEMTRIRAGQIRAPLNDGTADLPRKRRFLDEAASDEAGLDDDVSERAPRPSASNPAAYKQFDSLDAVDEAWGQQVRREDPKVGQGEVQYAAGLDELQYVKTMTSGEITNFEQITDLPRGITVTKAVKEDHALKGMVPLFKGLVNEYLPGARVILGKGVSNPKHSGEALSYGDNHVIGLVPDRQGNELKLASVTVHEVGHAVFNHWAKRVPPEIIANINKEWLDFVNSAVRGELEAADQRFSARFNSLADRQPMKTTAYNISRDEWFAENFVKHVQKRALEGDFKVPANVLDMIVLGLKKAFAMFIDAKRAGVVNPAESVEEFANFVLTSNAAKVQRRLEAVSGAKVPRRGGPTATPVAPKPSAQAAYHGTPHEPDKLTTDRVGEGEGNIAFGWGLYFAGKREIAEWYASVLGRREGMQQGNLYQVEVPEDDVLLDWDAPVSAQPAAVQRALAASGIPQREIDKLTTGKRLYRRLSKEFGGAKAASVWLAEQGVPGLRYFDGPSRKAQSGTRNYVVFQDDAVTMVGKLEESLDDPLATEIGLTLAPTQSTGEAATAKHILTLHRKANEWGQEHPRDEGWLKRAQSLLDNSLLPAASTGLRLLKSNNPVARWVASELLEDASGVSGTRQSTAAISKFLHEQKFLGNTVNDVQHHYAIWRKGQGGGLKDDYIGGEYWARFNTAVAAEIELRRNGGQGTGNASIAAAADSLEAAYDRIRLAQIKNKTLGWGALGETSKGYMPHIISPKRWLALSNEQRKTVHMALVDQFVTIEGWDGSFADGLASRYLDRVQQRATGGHDSPIGGASAGSAEIIEDALIATGMSPAEVRKQMQRFNRGAAQWTKGRINLDLNKVYNVAGQEFTLLDVFETDQIALLRSQAGRASGEVALARYGVYGRPGLEAIRKAMQFGKDGQRATIEELEAFDQVAAEFMSAPYGTAEPKWMERARVLNSVVRLGGVVFNQFAEFSNALVHVGLGRTLAGVASMGRLKTEIKALAQGKTVDNPLIGSIEKLGGAEFGTQAYKIVMPFDSPDHAYPTYGRDTLSNMDRLLRGASHAQAKLSLWRTVHSVQQRAMAEQIVAKIGRYVQDGKEDAALRQFGITPELQAAIARDGVARFENGSLVEFDVTKLKDANLREDLIHAVHRGVNQIIQGTFIGETGKWAHDGYLKMLTQFRTFSLTAMEKQWARQRNSRGTAQALGILLGSMFAVYPVYAARVYANSIGREDQEAYIEERMNLAAVARQTLNYVALSGLAGDFFDAAAALAPEDLGLKAATGGRSGQDTEFVGNLVAPALSLVDDGWKALQNLDDPEKIARMLPGSRIPYLLPAINALGD